MNIENIKFKVGRESVAGTLFHPENPNGLGVLFFHGWNSSRKGYIERAKSICELGYYCLTIDLRGFGESDGSSVEFSISDHVDDVIAAFDFLKNSAEINEVSACGASMGGFLVAMLSAKRELRSVVFRSPGIYPDKVLDKKGWNDEEELLREIWSFKNNNDFQNSSVIKILDKFEGSSLIIGSTEDHKIPKIVIEKYYESMINVGERKLVWITGADHPLAELKH